MDDDDGPPKLVECGSGIIAAPDNAGSTGLERKVPITIVTGMGESALPLVLQLLTETPYRLPRCW